MGRWRPPCSTQPGRELCEPKGEGPSKYEFEGPSVRVLPSPRWRPFPRCGCPFHRGGRDSHGCGSCRHRGDGTPHVWCRFHRRSGSVVNHGCGSPRRRSGLVSHGAGSLSPKRLRLPRAEQLLGRRTGHGTAPVDRPLRPANRALWPLRRWRPVSSGEPVPPRRCDLGNGPGVPPRRRPRTSPPEGFEDLVRANPVEAVVRYPVDLCSCLTAVPSLPVSTLRPERVGDF